MINILYCGDKNIEDGLMVSVLSLLKNSGEELNIFVLTLSLSAKETGGRELFPVTEKIIQYLDRRAREQNAQSRVRLMDATELFKKQMPTANMATRFTPCCMLRLYADQIPEIPDRILYLDNDVVCRRDFAAFYHQEMEAYELAGVLDYYGKWFFRRSPFRMDYLNSGVLLLNMTKIRRTGLFARCRELCRNKKMFMPDQSAINKLAGTKKICHRKYNDQRRLHEDTVLQHFSTTFRFFPWIHTLTVKPWEVERVHSVLKLTEYDDLLEEYIRERTGLRDVSGTMK